MSCPHEKTQETDVTKNQPGASWKANETHYLPQNRLPIVLLLIYLAAFRAEKVLFPLVAAIGLGGTFQVSLIGIHAAMPLQDIATSTAALVFIRHLGASIGVSIGQAIFSSIAREKVSQIPGIEFDTSAAELGQIVPELKLIPGDTTRAAVIQALATSISRIWLVMTPLIGVSFILVLFIRKYTLKRPTVRQGDDSSS